MLASEFIKNKLYLDPKYKYVLLYYYDKIIFEPISSISDVDLNYLVQGWIFGEWCQAFIFKRKDEILCKISDYSERKNDLIYQEKQILDSRFSNIGQALLIKKFGKPDDDGQVQVDSILIADIVR